VTLALALFSVFGLLGCGSSGGGSSAEAVIAVDPVDLAPGLTVAELAWPASEGPVENYLVFASRNGGVYNYNQTVIDPTANIPGQPGDTVQITVVAVSPTGEVSESSPPSPPLIFHAAEAGAEALVAQAAASGVAPLAATEAATEAASEAATESDETTLADAADVTESEAQETPEADVADEETTSPLAQATRALLLGADARLPERGLSLEASQWLQAQVDQEIAAGVSLVGTGHRFRASEGNADALSDLVWQDHAGQLFVSDGQSVLDSDDLAATFDEAPRLGATERFLGLADFDGDGQGDWLLENTSTGAVWVVDGESGLSLFADPTDATAQLAGHGDFDGDGRAELLWLDAHNRPQITRPGDAAPALDPAGFESPSGFEFLAIADLDGNGLDDLLGRGSDGMLVIAYTIDSDTPDAPALTVEWQAGPADLAEGLDLVATLDLDGDGAAEIAWLNGESLEIWNAESGLQMTFGP